MHSNTTRTRSRVAVIGAAAALTTGLAMLVATPAVAEGLEVEAQAELQTPVEVAPEGVAEPLAEIVAEPIAQAEPLAEPVTEEPVGEAVPQSLLPEGAPAELADAPAGDEPPFGPDDLGVPEEEDPLLPDLDAGNQAPVAKADAYNLAEDEPLSVPAPGVLGNDTDSVGSQLSAGSVLPPGGGVLAGEELVLASDGSFLYTPAPDFVGQRVWTYATWDGELLSQPTSITFTVLEGDKVGPNLKPVAHADFYSIKTTESLDVDAADGLLANDTDPEGAELNVTWHKDTDDGDLYIFKDGSFTFVPALGFTGVIELQYMIWDGVQSSDPGTLVIEVEPLPLAQPDPQGEVDPEPAPEQPAKPAAADQLAHTGVAALPLGGAAALLLGLGGLARVIGSRRAH